MFSKIILVQKNLFLSQKENSEHLVEVVWGALLYISITPPKKDWVLECTFPSSQSKACLLSL